MALRTRGLLDLPADVLGVITSRGTGSHSALALWKCGNALLNHKLARGVPALPLRDARIISHIVFAPAALFEFRNLRVLEVRQTHARVLWRCGVQALPPTLTHLSLVFAAVAAVVPALPPHLDRLRHLEIGDPLPTTADGLSPRLLDALPALLHTLKLSRIEQDLADVTPQFGQPLLHNIFRQVAPTEPVQVRMREGAMVAGVGKLPASLRVLHLAAHDYADCTRHFAQHPPLALEEFCVWNSVHVTDACVQPYHVSALPRSLTTLDFGLLSPPSMPSSLLSLFSLPPVLTRLAVQVVRPQGEYMRAVWQGIPRTVTDLSVLIIDHYGASSWICEPNEFRTCLPPHLRALHVDALPIAWHHDTLLGNDFWPTTLREMRLGRVDPHVAYNLAVLALPGQLTSLRLEDALEVDWRGRAAAHRLLMLRTLCIATTHLDFGSLPHLTALDLRFTKHTQFATFRAPLSLLHLTVRVSYGNYTVHELGVVHLLAALPATLRTLDLSCFVHLRASTGTQFFAALPPALTSLAVFMPHDATLSANEDAQWALACMHLLPPALRRLTLVGRSHLASPVVASVQIRLVP